MLCVGSLCSSCVLCTLSSGAALLCMNGMITLLRWSTEYICYMWSPMSSRTVQEFAAVFNKLHIPASSSSRQHLRHAIDDVHTLHTATSIANIQINLRIRDMYNEYKQHNEDLQNFQQFLISVFGEQQGTSFYNDFHKPYIYLHRSLFHNTMNRLLGYKKDKSIDSNINSSICPYWLHFLFGELSAHHAEWIAYFNHHSKQFHNILKECICVNNKQLNAERFTQMVINKLNAIVPRVSSCMLCCNLC